MTDRSCKCRDWTKWANDPFFPVWYNATTNEYVIIFGEIATNIFIIYYCPSCGGKMPESRRGDLFKIPSKEELAEARSLLDQITDVDTMYSLLGKPDDIVDRDKDLSGAPIHNPDSPGFKRQYAYFSRWQTLRVSIQEAEDGQLRFFFCGQVKRADGAS